MGSPAFADERREGRDDILYRTRAIGPHARPLTLLIVNVSPHGLMARCDASFEAGQQIQVTLPAVGIVTAEIRWALGGRIGCQFETAIELAGYYEMVAALVRTK